jgi:hypothetical protein
MVVAALLARGLAAETINDTLTPADAALNRFWRNEVDGRPVLLHLTEAGLFAAQNGDGAATGAGERDAGSPGADSPDSAPAGATGAQDAHGAGKAAPAADSAPTGRTPRPGTKQATLIGMLRSDSGATIDEIAAATGWQAHTVRGAFAGAMKKRLWLEVTSEKVEGRGRVYRLPVD